MKLAKEGSGRAEGEAGEGVAGWHEGCVREVGRKVGGDRGKSDREKAAAEGRVIMFGLRLPQHTYTHPTTYLAQVESG